jgi:putative tricarboxylic transport membrane protein
MQAVASFAGGTAGVIPITVLAPLFAQVTRSFGPPEFFLLVMMGLTTLTVMVGGNWRYGAISALIGFALAFVPAWLLGRTAGRGERGASGIR